MLDNLPPLWRHLVIGLLAALLGWAGTDVVPWLAEHGPLAAVAGAVLGQVLLVVTPLVRQYGAGSGKRGDHEAGSARTGVLAVVLALTLAAALTVPASAHRHPAARPGPLYVGVWSACQRTGVLEVGYGTERLQGGVWGIVPDSWGADLQLHFVGNGAAEGGQWETVPGIRRTEGHVAAVVSGLPTWDSARVVLRDGDVVVASSGRTPEACPA